MAVRTVSVELIAKISQYATNMTKAAAYAKKLDSELMQLAKKSPERFNHVALAAGAAGVSLLGVAGAVVKMESEFEKAMSGVSAATHAGAADMEALRQAAIQAGQATQFSATEAAQGITELAKAGISTSAILRGGLKGALDLAAAGQMDVAEAAEVAATALTQFRLKGSDVPHVADLLAAGAGKAQGSVHDLSLALKQSGLVASQFGLSVETTTGTLAAFASAGLVGSDAGTSFKQMLLQLAAPSQKAADLMDELGIRAYDAQGKFVGIIDLAEQLHTKLSGLTQAQRDYALATIFGTDAIRSANVLYQQGAAGIRDWTAKVDDAGYASDTAARLTNNLSGDVERLTGSLDSLAIKSGTGANDGLRTLTKSANALVDTLSGLPGWMQQTIVVTSALGGVSLLAGSGFLKAKQKAAELTETLATMGPAGTKAARGLQLAGRAASYAAIAFIGMEVINTIADQMKDAYPPTVKLASALREFSKSGQVGADGVAVFGADLGKLKEDLDAVNDPGVMQKFGKSLYDITGESGGFALTKLGGDLTKATENVKQFDSALADLVSQGRGEEASKVVAQLGLSTEQVNKLLPQYAAAQEEVKVSSEQAAEGQAKAAEAAKKITSSFQDAYAAANGLSDAFDALNKRALDSDDAISKLETAYDNADQAIKDNGKTLDIHTAAGRANRDALKDIARAAGDAMQAMADNGSTVQDVEGKYKEARKKFVDAAMAMGKTRTEANKLADQWLKMPPVVETEVKAPGLDPTLSHMNKLNAEMDRFDGREVRSTVTTEFINYRHDEVATHSRRWGGITTHAATGSLRDAKVYSAVSSGARYAFAEPATGGEAFVPKYGDYNRSISILSQAARWYGAMVVPGGSQASAQPAISPQALGAAVKAALQGMTVTLDGHAVGTISGRRADILRRGGY